MEVEENKIEESNGNGRGEKQDISMAEIIHYSNQGLSQTEIAEKLGCTQANISLRMNKEGYTPVRAKAFKENKKDIVLHMQDKILSSVTEKDLKQAPLIHKIKAVEALEKSLGTDEGVNPHIGLQIIVQGATDKTKAILQRGGKVIAQGEIETDTEVSCSL